MRCIHFPSDYGDIGLLGTNLPKVPTRKVELVWIGKVVLLCNTRHFHSNSVYGLHISMFVFAHARKLLDRAQLFGFNHLTSPRKGAGIVGLTEPIWVVRPTPTGRQRNVRSGSIATELGCLRDVRFPPVSDQIADIA
jgi:hypothetical protein